MASSLMRTYHMHTDHVHNDHTAHGGISFARGLGVPTSALGNGPSGVVRMPTNKAVPLRSVLGEASLLILVLFLKPYGEGLSLQTRRPMAALKSNEADSRAP